jgi:hypothetical protein
MPLNWLSGPVVHDSCFKLDLLGSSRGVPPLARSTNCPA